VSQLRERLATAATRFDAAARAGVATSAAASTSVPVVSTGADSCAAVAAASAQLAALLSKYCALSNDSGATGGAAHAELEAVEAALLRAIERLHDAASVDVQEKLSEAEAVLRTIDQREDGDVCKLLMELEALRDRLQTLVKSTSASASDVTRVQTEIAKLETRLADAKRRANETSAQANELVRQLRAQRCAEDLRVLATRVATKALVEWRALRDMQPIREQIVGDLRVLGEQYRSVLGARCMIAVVGVRGSGKSTLVNALVGGRLLPTSHMTCSAVSVALTHVAGCTSPRLTLPTWTALNEAQQQLRALVRDACGAQCASPAAPLGVDALLRRLAAPECASALRALASDEPPPAFAATYEGEAMIERTLARLHGVLLLMRRSRELQQRGDEPLVAPFASCASFASLPHVEVEFACLRGVPLSSTVTLVDMVGTIELMGELTTRCDRAIEVIDVKRSIGLWSSKRLHERLLASGVAVTVVGARPRDGGVHENDASDERALRQWLALDDATPIVFADARGASAALCGLAWIAQQRARHGADAVAPDVGEYDEHEWLRVLYVPACVVAWWLTALRCANRMKIQYGAMARASLSEIAKSNDSVGKFESVRLCLLFQCC
jgi:GTPase SAR1 family protein